MEYRTHLYVHISIHIYKEEDKIQQTIHKCKLRRHTNKKTLDVPEVQHFGRHFFGGGQQSTTRSNNESERMWNAVSFCLICCRYFFFFWSFESVTTFFRLRVPPVQQEKIWKKKCFFFRLFGGQIFWPIFREERNCLLNQFVVTIYLVASGV